VEKLASAVRRRNRMPTAIPALLEPPAIPGAPSETRRFLAAVRKVRIHLPPAARLRTIIPSVTGVGWSIPLSLILSPGVSILSGVGAATDEEQVGQSSPASTVAKR
jgi:hypothetical protein